MCIIFYLFIFHFFFFVKWVCFFVLLASLFVYFPLFSCSLWPWFWLLRMQCFFTHGNYTDESMPVNMCTTVCYSTGYNNKMQSKEQYDKSLNLANEMHKICNQKGMDLREQRIYVSVCVCGCRMEQHNKMLQSKEIMQKRKTTHGNSFQCWFILNSFLFLGIFQFSIAIFTIGCFFFFADNNLSPIQFKWLKKTRAHALANNLYIKWMPLLSSIGLQNGVDTVLYSFYTIRIAFVYICSTARI